MLASLVAGLIAASVVAATTAGAGSGEDAATAQEAALVINEVLYDPVGKDAGFEFVEIFNPAPGPLCLEGWRLETGNGSYEDRWTLEWTGSRDDTVDGRSFFVIGEESVSPAPQGVTDLDLQNGPDACRLLSPGATADLVGWGEHTYSEYYEGNPAAAVPSGESLGRDPDGSDTGRNAVDFKGFDQPSPGDFNHPPCDLALVRAGLSRYADVSASTIDLVCVVTNSGTDPCGRGARIAIEVGPVADSVALSADVLPGGQSRDVLRIESPGSGLHRATFRLRCEGDKRAANDSLGLTFVIPPPPAVINEVMFCPSADDCEWLEILNRSDRALALDGWTIEDSGGRPKAIAAPPLEIEQGRTLVLVEDAAAFARAYGDSEEIAFMRPEDGWPTLNDVNGALGFADALVLRDASGTAVDSIAYGDDWSSAGLSVERIDPGGRSTDAANWSPHYGPGGGSPGRTNSVSFFLPRSGRILDVSPAKFSPDGDGRDDLAAISIRLAGRSVVSLGIYDLNGFLVRRLVDGETMEAGRVTFWDGRNDHGERATVGVYIIAVEVSAVSPGGVHRAKAPVVLLGR